MLDQPSILPELRFVAVRHDTVTDPPLAKLLPSSTCDQSVDIVSLTPYIVLLHIRLLSFRIAYPLVDLVGYCIISELSEPRGDGG